MVDWRPAASIDVLKMRALILARIREFFRRRDVLEVETPALSASGATDPHLHSFTVRTAFADDRAAPAYLHTSPEFPMKRLLAAGSGSIYQICKVFRDAEVGRLHNAEFTLVEWYRVGLGYRQLMDEVAALVAESLESYRTLAPTEKLTYRGAFVRTCDIDPHGATSEEMINLARARGIVVTGLSADDRDGWRDLLLTQLVEPQLGNGRLTFIYDFPAAAAALARIRPGEPPVAERFELYLDGVELANGFQELTDPQEQRRRFEQDARTRRQRGLPAVPMDNRFIAALAHGLPACSGVALGFDRLVMSAARAASVAETLAFPLDRA
jgi:elongation factor P--(R)-beta-lysine ligase